jgi:hypothetical protein
VGTDWNASILRPYPQKSSGRTKNPMYNKGQMKGWKIISLVIIFAAIIIAGAYLLFLKEPRISPEERDRLIILEQLSKMAEDLPPLSEEDRNQIIENLSDQNASSFSEEERLKILEFLSQ